MYFLTIDEVLSIHNLIITKTGGIDKIRNKNLLEKETKHDYQFKRM